MDQRQVFSNMQTTMSIVDTEDDVLGAFIIGSALYTEFALAGILFAEADKIRAAFDVTDVTAAGLALVDDSVANVLDHVCCIEKQIVKKIELGIELRNGNGNGNGPGPRPGKGHGNGYGKA